MVEMSCTKLSSVHMFMFIDSIHSIDAERTVPTNKCTKE